VAFKKKEDVTQVGSRKRWFDPRNSELAIEGKRNFLRGLILFTFFGGWGGEIYEG